MSREADEIIVVEALKLIEEAYEEVFAAHSSLKQVSSEEEVNSTDENNGSKTKDRNDEVWEEEQSYVSDSVEGNKNLLLEKKNEN